MPRPVYAAPRSRASRRASICTGAEFLAGIPGTVGGALAMNAGCYGGETWDIVERACNHRSRRPRCGNAAQERIRDRLSALPMHRRDEEWFIGRVLRLRRGDGAASAARIKELLASASRRSRSSQPNAGRVFRNPPGDYAARLIEACGLKGLARGGARVSAKHANFIVNPTALPARRTSKRLILARQAGGAGEDRGRASCPKCASWGEPA